MWRWRPVQQMQNIDSAKIYGVEFTGKLNLNEVTPMPNGWKLFGSLGYSKGSMSNGASLMSLQPIKAIIGLDYEQPDGKWGIFSRLTYLGAQKAKNAKYLKTVERCVKKNVSLILTIIMVLVKNLKLNVRKRLMKQSQKLGNI